jgi:hypothetical protein
MLPEVISGSIGLTNVVSPIRRLCPRTNLIMREVEDIDLRKQIVTISPGFRPRQLQLKYDHLVIALGNITDFHGMPGLMEANSRETRTLRWRGQSRANPSPFSLVTGKNTGKPRPHHDMNVSNRR